MSSKEIKLEISSFSEADLQLEKSCSDLMGISWAPTDISSSTSKAMRSFEVCVQDLMDAFKDYSALFERDCENIYKAVSEVKDVDYLLAKNFEADRKELINERHADDIARAVKEEERVKWQQEKGAEFSNVREEQSKVDSSAHFK